MSKFEITFFSPPTEGHFYYFWARAQEAKISQSKFEKLWFDAYNDYLSRLAENSIRKNYWKLVDIVHQNGDMEQKNSMRELMNKGLKVLEKRLK